MSRKPPMWGYRERPELVWAITLLYLIGIGFGTYTIVMALLGRLPMTGPSRELLSSHGVLFWTATAAILVGKLMGTVLLWLGRRQALYFYAASFAIRLAQFAWVAATRGRLLVDALESPSLYGTAVGWLLNILVIGYVVHLSRKKWDD